MAVFSGVIDGRGMGLDGYGFVVDCCWLFGVLCGGVFLAELVCGCDHVF